jgi:hypothetical protein
MPSLAASIFITEMKGVPFIHGLPTTDFHYALIWTGEYDRPREGFLSWSWTGWHSLQQYYLMYRLENGTCSLEEDGYGNLQTVGRVDRDIELQGTFITPTDMPRNTNKCSQRFANISFLSHKTNTLLTVTSEIAHFSLDILPVLLNKYKCFGHLVTSKCPIILTLATRTLSTDISWVLNSEYRTPFDRMRLRDDYNNAHTYHYPYWYKHWPPLTINLPRTLFGETLAWLLKEGIESIMILEVELLEGDSSLKPFHQVLCLGVDREGMLRRDVTSFADRLIEL